MDFISKSMFQRIFDYKSNCQSILIKIKLSKAFDGLAPDVCGANEPRSAHAQLNAKHFFGHTQQYTWTFCNIALPWPHNALSCSAILNFYWAILRLFGHIHLFCNSELFSEPYCTSSAIYCNAMLGHIELFTLPHCTSYAIYCSAILHFWASISSTRSTEQ